jgi:hypothetical protein
MQTLEDALIANGIEPAPRYACSHCHKSFPAFQFVSGAAAGLEGWACVACIQPALRQLAVEAAEAAQELAVDPWDTEAGHQIRADRNARLEATRWAWDAASPLTPACQALFLAYAAALHRITVDYETPQAVVFPEVPALEYAPLEP